MSTGDITARVAVLALPEVLHKQTKVGQPCPITCPPLGTYDPTQDLQEAEQELPSEVETLRWYMAGQVAMSTDRCPCWMSRHDLTFPPPSSETWGP